MIKFVELEFISPGGLSKRLINVETIFTIGQHPKNVIGRCILCFAFNPEAGIELNHSYEEAKKRITDLEPKLISSELCLQSE